MSVKNYVFKTVSALQTKFWMKSLAADKYNLQRHTESRIAYSFIVKKKKKKKNHGDVSAMNRYGIFIE